MDVAAFVPELAEKFSIVEAIADPWRTGQMSREWEQRGITAVAFPQHDARMIPASQVLHDAVVEQRLVHPTDPRLNAHVAAAVARHTRTRPTSAFFPTGRRNPRKERSAGRHGIRLRTTH